MGFVVNEAWTIYSSVNFCTISIEDVPNNFEIKWIKICQEICNILGILPVLRIFHFFWKAQTFPVFVVRIIKSFVFIFD